MSITAETAQAHAKDPAVLCCRAEAGITIEPANLEDPAIFDELVDSGLLNLDGVLTIGQVLGATLTKTSDSLSALTPDNVKDYKEAGAVGEDRQGGCTESISVRVSCCFIKSLEMFMGALVRSTHFCAMIRITFR